MIELARSEQPIVEPQPEELIGIFNQLFSESENTRLVLGDSEPIYLPADQACHYHRVVFAHGFFASALHEMAHWCLAGQQRRQHVDYGYWYVPDGRDSQQQAEFERVEVKPQALEWILGRACRQRFRLSSDNLSGQAAEAAMFKQAVYKQVLNYCQRGLPARAGLLQRSLCDFYQSSPVLDAASFHLAEAG